MAGHVAFHVDKALRRARGEDARRPVAGDVQSASGAFAAAHRKDDSPRADLEKTVGAVGSGDDMAYAIRRAGARNNQHHCIQKIRNARFLHLIDKASGILGAGQLLMKRSMQPEAVMNALI